MKYEPYIIEDVAIVNNNVISVRLIDGTISKFDASWLMHINDEPHSLHVTSGQRYIKLNNLGQNLRIESACRISEKCFEVYFRGDSRAFRFYTPTLFDHLIKFPSQEQRPILWDSDLDLNNLTFRWSDISQPKVRKLWIRALIEYGFVRIIEAPYTPGFIEEFVNSFGRIKPNRFGNTFDVEHTPDPSNLAFTNQALPLHTDNPYRNPVPGFQILHCISPADEGGESILADGFNSANLLRDDYSKEFESLCSTPVVFRYKSENVWFEDKTKIIEIGDAGKIHQIRHNNRSLQPPKISHVLAESFYEALRRFDEIVHRPQSTLKFNLNAGDLFICDNHRVLHSRTSFSTSSKRLLQGAYCDRDWLESHYRLAL